MCVFVTVLYPYNIDKSYLRIVYSDTTRKFGTDTRAHRQKQSMTSHVFHMQMHAVVCSPMRSPLFVCALIRQANWMTLVGRQCRLIQSATLEKCIREVNLYDSRWIFNLNCSSCSNSTNTFCSIILTTRRDHPNYHSLLFSRLNGTGKQTRETLLAHRFNVSIFFPSLLLAAPKTDIYFFLKYSIKISFILYICQLKQMGKKNKIS